MRWTALTNGGVFVKSNEDLGKLNVQELKDLLQQNPNLMKKIMFYGCNLRGTKAYWYTRCGELKDMIEQLDLPTVFITLSAADLHWIDLFRLLTDKPFETLTEQERRTLLQENPMICDQFFHERVQSFIKIVLEPRYKVKDFWYRIEFQHRGSPHLHGVFWFEGAPDVTDLDDKSEEEKEEILKYFDKLVSAVNPDPQCPRSEQHPCRRRFEDITDLKEDLAQLLRTVQRHTRCSPDYCLRFNQKNKKTECRFKFPVELSDESVFKTSESGTPEFCPKRNDEWLNKYNAYLLHLWRANVDVSPVLSKKALILYLAKYIAKSEPRSRGFESLFTSLLETMNENDPCKKFIQRYLIRTCGERDFSAQEVTHILLGLKLYSSGNRKFVTIRLPSVVDWVPVIEDDNTRRTFTDKYTSRPSWLEELTLWSAAKSYNPSTWKRLKKEAVVRIFPKYTLTEDEDVNIKYYRQMVLLHTPWRELLPDSTPWKQLYLDYNLNSGSGVQCLLENVDAGEEGELELEEDINQADDIRNEEWMIAAQLGTHHELPSIELGRRDIDINYPWTSTYEKYKEYGTLEEISKFLPSKKTEADPIQEVCEPLQDITFNQEQEKILQLLQQQLATINNNDSIMSPPVPRRVIVQGKAGTGKSVLIKEMIRQITNHLGPDAYLLVATTGIAALNIGGKTVHSVFSVPKDIKSFEDLKGERARNFCNLMSIVKFIILDEYSMLGSSLLAIIDKRCRQGTGLLEQDFGGLIFYMFGDIRQLPPVLDIPLYSCKQKTPLSQHGKTLFDNFSVTFFLHECHRQRDPVFQELLDKISVGDISISDYNLLSTRFTSASSVETNSSDETLRLFATREQVNVCNLKMLQALKDKDSGQVSSIARVPAIHNNKTAEKATNDEADGLAPVLYLAKDSKVMLLHNLWTKKGLVNGTRGTVVDILYDVSQSSPNNLPKVVLCCFNSYTGPALFSNPKVVPLYAVKVSWVANNGINCTRLQFPLALSYACSIHKSQGMTLDKAIVDIGNREFSLGLTYVAFSRVKTLTGLQIVPFCYDRIVKLRTLPSMVTRLDYEDVLKSKALR